MTSHQQTKEEQHTRNNTTTNKTKYTELAITDH